MRSQRSSREAIPTPPRPFPEERNGQFENVYPSGATELNRNAPKAPAIPVMAALIPKAESYKERYPRP